MTDRKLQQAWVTGARGFIGRNLARHLVRGGCRVSGIGHGAWAAQDAAQWGVALWLHGEIDRANLDLLLQQTGEPDCIFHLAGGSSVGPSFASPQEDFLRTVDTTARLLDWVRARVPQCRVVAASSAAVYGAGHQGPIAESAAITPFSPYGYHKAVMELLCRSYGANFGLHLAVLRLFSVYGAGLRKQLLWDLCTKLESSRDSVTLDGTGGETRDWLHVEDAARLLMRVAAVAGPSCPFVNGGTGRSTSIRDLAALVTATWQPARTVVFSGRSRAGDPLDLIADTGCASRLGFSPLVNLTTGVEAFVRWYRSGRGPL